jgi:hypothetical protein
MDADAPDYAYKKLEPEPASSIDLPGAPDAQTAEEPQSAPASVPQPVTPEEQIALLQQGPNYALVMEAALKFRGRKHKRGEATARDIARRVGVSIQTFSLARKIAESGDRELIEKAKLGPDKGVSFARACREIDARKAA